jgi:Phage derived protein Gp49-like (DUF891)
MLVLMYLIWYTVSVVRKTKSLNGADTEPDPFGKQEKRVPVFFFRTEAGGRTRSGLVEESALICGSEAHWRGSQDGGIWLASRMPVCKPLGDGIYEVRSNLAQNRIARVLFYIESPNGPVHGFIKKTRKTPQEDLEFREATKVSIKGDFNERKEKTEENGSHWFALR